MNEVYAKYRLEIVRKRREECKAQMKEKLNDIKVLKKRIEVYDAEEEMLLRELEIGDNKEDA